MPQAARLLPYVRSPPVATPPKPLAEAAKSHARPFGCSPKDACRKQAVYRVKPAARACCSALAIRGVRQPPEVGSSTVQPSLGKEPSERRGAARLARFGGFAGADASAGLAGAGRAAR